MVVQELFGRLGLQIDEAAFAKADAIFVGLSKSFIAFGSAAVAGITIAAAAIAKGTADSADHFKKLAQSTGVPAEALQRLSYSANLAGVDSGELAHGLQHLAKTGVKDVQAAVLQLSERFKTMPDDGEKVRVAMEKFGKTGAKLIPFLNSISEADLADANVFSSEQLDAAEEFNDNLTRLGNTFTGIRNAIGNRLIPVLNRFVLGMLAFVRMVRANWTPAVEKLMLGLRVLAFTLGGLVLAALVANIGAIATAVSWYVALGIAAVVAAVKAAVAWAAAAAPLLALAAIFAIILLAIEDVYYFLTGGESLIGELGPKWTKFLDEFTKPNATDPWWLAALKEALYFVTHLYEIIPKALDSLSAGFDKFKAWLPTVDPAFAAMVGASPAAPAFGGGSSPAASVALSPNARGVTVSSPQFSVQKIEVNASPGMSAQEVAGHVTQALDAHFDAKMREAVTGAQ